MRTHYRKSARGFTLLELVIVIVVLAILAGLAVPRYVRTVNRSRGSEALTMLGNLRESFERYYARNSTYVGIANDFSNVDVDPTSVTGNINFTYAPSGLGVNAYTITATFTGAGGGTVLLTCNPACAITGTGQFLGI